MHYMFPFWEGGTCSRVSCCLGPFRLVSYILDWVQFLMYIPHQTLPPPFRFAPLEIFGGHPSDTRKLIESNIGLWREYSGLIGGQYWTAKGVQWAHQSSILDSRGSPVGPLQSILNSRGSPVSSLECNIGLWRESSGFNNGQQRESGELIGIQYWTAEGVQWAHFRSILDCGGSPILDGRGSPVGSLQSNIGLTRKSGGLIAVQYWSAERVQADKSSILD
jgi:hypothetical protein